MFLFAFTEVLNDEEAVEDGEVSDSKDVKSKYKLDMLIDYPGFNVPVPEGVRDVSAAWLWMTLPIMLNFVPFKWQL